MTLTTHFGLVNNLSLSCLSKRVGWCDTFKTKNIFPNTTRTTLSNLKYLCFSSKLLASCCIFFPREHFSKRTLDPNDFVVGLNQLCGASHFRQITFYQMSQDRQHLRAVINPFIFHLNQSVGALSFSQKHFSQMTFRPFFGAICKFSFSSN